MIVLLCGGPHAGRALEWPDPLPPTISFPIMPRIRLDQDAPSPTTLLDPERCEYRKGSGTARLAAGEVCAYHYCGVDKYRTARTLERLVPFKVPSSVQEIQDKALVAALLASLDVDE